MTKVVIIGAGRGGRALLELFRDDPEVTILGVSDMDPRAPGIELARAMGVPVLTDFAELLRRTSEVDVVINVTGDPDVSKAVWDLKPDQAEVMGGLSAKFMWDLIEERKTKEAMADRMELMLRELDRHGEMIIGRNAKMKAIAELIAKVAPTPTTVLIRGGSGTGKELVARALHKYSHVQDRPLVTVNCTALTPTLMESELFGHKKGAFTGALVDKIGLFEKADGGTIFLDEIGDITLEMQAKLLRVLQTGEIRAVGDVTTRKVRVRIIAATNRNLEQAIARGEFREDLFYRFNTFTITLPPLRERTEDIPTLAYYFLKKAEAKVNKKVKRITPEALECLKVYSWPGNLRELENIIERAVVLTSSGQVEAEHLPVHVQEGQARARQEGFADAKRRLVQRFERDALSRYLQEASGNISLAAKKARMTRRTFHRLIAKHRVSPTEFKPGSH
ncbi:MAG: sigma-54-dependent Fis family transcriptional regulator [Deltaproteobacteria bacterium]|nr:sigma-54-dependent Fis family transcriptional regulator [Deltaproteobacteria bacterium]